MSLDLKGKSRDEQFRLAAEFAGVPTALFRGMWKVESNDGTNMRSPAGARGHFQIMPKTQKTWEKRLGRLLDPDNFEDGLVLAANTMKENMGAAKGNVEKALAMYNGGWDAAKRDNPETRAYAGKVLGAAGLKINAPTYDAPTKPRALTPDEVWNTSADDIKRRAANYAVDKKAPMSDLDKGVVSQAGMEAAVTAVIAGDGAKAVEDKVKMTRTVVADNVGEVTDKAAASWEATGQGTGTDTTGWDFVQKQSDAEDAEYARVQAISFGDKFAAAFDNNALTAGIARYIEKQDFLSEHSVKGRTAGFDYLAQADDIEKDRDSNEIDELRRATSLSEVAEIKARQDVERANNRTISDGSSTLGVIGYNLLGGVADPVGWVAGFGVGKTFQVAGIGARTAFLSGKTAKGFALAGAEGSLGNVLVTGTLDAMGEHQSSYDFGMSAGFGFVMGSTMGVFNYRSAKAEIKDTYFRELGEKMEAEAAAYNADLYLRAQAEAGPGASVEEVKAVATRLNAEADDHIRRVLLGDVPDDMRLFPRPDVNEPRPETSGAVAPEPVPMPHEDIPVTAVTESNGDTDTVNFSLGGKEVGYIEVDVNGKILESRIPDEANRGQGIGKAMYSALIDRALRAGKTITSDGHLTEDAARVWNSLYQNFVIEKNPTAQLNKTTRAWFSEDGEPVFRVIGKRENMTAGVAAPKMDHLPGAILDTPAKRAAAYERYRLNDSISDDAERKIVAEQFARAEAILGQNPIDPERLRPLLAKIGWEATSTRMLLSDSPVMRAFALVALENPEGAAGRNVTAAMTKAMRERVYIGDTLREYEGAYSVWRNRQGGSDIRDFVSDKQRREFDRKVYAERDRRFNKKPSEEIDPEVKLASDVLDRGYNRMRADQKYVGTIGSARLSDVDILGYQPRRMAAGIVANLNDAQRSAFIKALSQEFQVTAGYDKAFSDTFAVKYLERVTQRAKGAYDVPANLHSDDAADMVRDALRALSKPADEIESIVGRFSRGGASHTKERIDADLTAIYDDGTGGSLMLMDIMDTNNLSLFRQYARRTSGEVSLAKYGIMGKQGAKELRKAMEVGPDGQRASLADLESYDQVIAEFLGEPFGTHLGKWADNARSFTSSLRLGGMGLNQFGEYSNAVGALGVARSFKAIAALPRLLSEVHAMKNGKAAPNTLLGSLETFGGDFGMDGYRLQGMYDVNQGFEVYGTEALTVVDKAIRAGAHGNRVLSMHRAITAVQIRGMAEQIVGKSLRFIREGREDVALADMGITPDVAARIRLDIEQAATFGPNGEPLSFDLTKISDPVAANQYLQAVHRGASQIIQDAYIGETGKWAHDGFLKLLTQFRSYGLTATQKQWRRQAFTHGTAKALGLLIGSASFAIPIQLARVQLRALGKEDREEYIDKHTSWEALGRSTMNYVAVAGVLPDVLDITSTAVGYSPTGGRAGNTSPFVGGQVLPAAGVVNDLYKAVQSRDPHSAAKMIPGSGLFYLQVGVNQLD